MVVVDGFDLLLFKQKTAYEMRISDWSSDVCSSDLLASIRIGKILDSSLRSIFGLNHLLVLSLGLANAIDTAEQCFPRVDCSLQRHEFFDGVEEFAEVDIMARTFDWFCWLDL